MIRLVLFFVGGAALVLLLAQLLLPGIGARRISSRVGRYGSVERVTVHAWPAVELLWGSADSASVRATHLSLSPSQAAKLLWEARGVETLELTAPSVNVGPLQLTDVHLHKHGSSLAADAVISEAGVKAALPPGFAVRLLGSEGGQVQLSASGGLFGVGPTVKAVAGPSQGKLVVHPLGFLLEGVRLTLFADPHVYVDGVGASLRPGSPPSYRLTMNASLR
jgi:DUF2993 family protein